MEEEVKVFLSLRRCLADIILCLALCALGIYVIIGAQSKWIGWICVIIFGICAALNIAMIVRERVKGKPFYLVGRESIELFSAGREFEIFFSDIEEVKGVSTLYIPILKPHMVAVRYKGEQKARVLLPSSGLSLSHEDFLKLLEKRVGQAKGGENLS